jgi:hypothetical protein
MAPLDIGIAQLLDDAGHGDFSAPASATPPVITVGEQLNIDSQITVLPVQGDKPDRILGIFPRYQVIVRATGDDAYADARDLAELIFLTLDQHQGALDGEPVGRIQPEFQPIPLSRDGSGIEGGRVEFTQTVKIHTR